MQTRVTATNRPPANHLLPDDFISISAAARLFPPKRGKAMAPSTLYRWGRRGKLTLYVCNGFRLSMSELQHRYGLKRVATAK